MKYSLFVATLVCALSALLAFTTNKTDEIYSQFVSYVNRNMEDLPIMRSSTCFETFIPHINSLADQAKDLSNVCISTAASKREALWHNGRAEVVAAVKAIQSSLTQCSSDPDDMGYLQCLQGIADENKEILDFIAKKSAELAKGYADGMKAIAKEENECLDKVVKDAKEKSDKGFADLKACMTNGYWSGSSQPPEQTTIQTTTDSDSEEPSLRTGP